MVSSGVSSAPAELFRALAVLAEPPAEGHGRVADALGLGGPPDGATYAQLFLLQFHPYASVYLGEEGMLGGIARDRVAGFWRAVGRTPPAEPDHLAALLGLYAALLDEAAEAPPAQAVLVRRSATALLHEHLAPWLPVFLAHVRPVAGAFFGRWADFLGHALQEELRTAPPPGGLPLHLRMAPGLPDPRAESAEAFLAGLLAPVRSGMILTRTDLADIGRSVGVAVKMGSRRSVVEHLLAEEPRAVLEALGSIAEERTGYLDPWAPFLGDSAVFWVHRVTESARLLRALAAVVEMPDGDPPSVEPSSARRSGEGGT